MWRFAGLAVAILAATAVYSPAARADVERRSGTVVVVEGGTLVLEEIGAGRAGQAGNEITRHRITFDESTSVVTVARSSEGAPDGWPGGFTVRRAEIATLREGACVTVTLRREPGRLTAEQVTIVVPEP